MIVRLRGRIVSEGPDRVVIDAQGVGYEVVVPPYQLRALRAEHLRGDDPTARLDALGREIDLHVFHHVPEHKPVPVLFGFLDANERRFFELLAGVSRFGPMAAAKSMVISVPDYATLILTRDVGALRRLPGIGTSKADQIIAELRSKVHGFAMMPRHELPLPEETPETELARQLVVALEDFGYRRHEAESMARAAMEAAPSAKAVDDLFPVVWEIHRRGS